jgi:hypothetical protein
MLAGPLVTQWRGEGRMLDRKVGKQHFRSIYLLNQVTRFFLSIFKVRISCSHLFALVFLVRSQDMGVPANMLTTYLRLPCKKWFSNLRVGGC